MEDIARKTLLKFVRQATEVAFEGLGGLFVLIGLGQATCHHRHELQWAEIDYFLQVRQVHIDTLNNMREDLLDLYEMDGRKLDTRMIVATLLLAIGFGFVVEGTFPPTEPSGADETRTAYEIYKAQHNPRIAYSIIAALALLSPFWSLLALMECRRRLDFFMDAFNDKFYQMLKNRFQSFLSETRSAQDIHASNLVRFTKGLPEDPWPTLASVYDAPCDARPGLNGICSWLGCAKRKPQIKHKESKLHEPGDFDIILRLHSHYAIWWYEWCWRFLRIASICTWLAIIFNVLCCSILLGMYFQYHYSDTPGMWRWYSSLLLIGLAAALGCTGLARLKGPRLNAKLKYVPDVPVPDVPMGIPSWMNEHGGDAARPLLQA
mmetsp:Transcript_108505/g.317455  ORF Transcript_108505/g.317455 Transcript_108505/m.317455 type:complete len:377 (-) Transcript_108505:4-1134(-)